MPKKQEPELHPDSLAIRVGRGDDLGLAPTLHPSTTYLTPSIDDGRRMATDRTEARFYARQGNPTVHAFESAMAELEGAEAARAFASGMGAMSAVILGLCDSGSHIVAQNQLYSGTTMFLQLHCPRFGIEVSFVDGTEPGAFANAVQKGRTQLIVAETPANPSLDLIDLEALAAIKGPIKVVDSTFAPPVMQRPLDYGIDLSLHSATKSIAGHNDASLGVVSGSEELIQWIWGFAILQGANASPFDAMNAIRGLRTLPIRIERQSASAQALAERLSDHPAVDNVRFPGLKSHPQHELAKKQMSQFGGLLSFDIVGGLDAGRRFVKKVKLAQMATSLGGPETLVTHPASTSHVGLLPEEMAAAGISPGTIRVSAGLEHVGDLIADFEQALAGA
jgi:cystathionine beta-lyase/cystathionine gamma-synthase